MGVGAVASGLVCYWTTTPLGGVLCSVAFVAVASRVPGEPAATSYVPGYDNRYIEDLWAVEIGSGPRAVAVTTYKIVHQLRMADGWHTVVNGIGYRVKAAPSGRAEQAKECQEFKTYGVRGKLELLNPCDFRAGWYPNV